MQPYTKIQNSIIQDVKLSYGATGLFCFMLSMRSDWKFNLQDLSKRKTDGRRKTRRCLQELIQFGYVKKTKETNSKGQITGWNWQLNPECQNVNLDNMPESNFSILDNPASNENEIEVNNPDVRFPHVAKQHTNNNSKRIITKNKEESPTHKSFKTYSLDDFLLEVRESAKLKTMPETMTTAFLTYWTEKSPSGKMKFQLGETWETSKRLDTWFRNQEKFQSNKPAWQSPKASISELLEKKKNIQPLIWERPY